jgi:hypothetical protein
VNAGKFEPEREKVRGLVSSTHKQDWGARRGGLDGERWKITTLSDIHAGWGDR